MIIFQKGFNFSQDGPGNRLVYHLCGCNLRCPWCSNPEGFSFENGKKYTVDEIVSEVLRSKAMMFDGGGVTFTGGEATIQFDELKETLIKLRENNINTCIETNGINDRLPELFPYLDLLIMDIKHYDASIHKKVTGLANESTLKNAVSRINSNQPLLLRIPLIGGFNSSVSDAKNFVRCFEELKIKDKITIELLKYHEFGISKYQKLGLEYKMDEKARITADDVLNFKKVLVDNNIKVINT